MFEDDDAFLASFDEPYFDKTTTKPPKPPSRLKENRGRKRKKPPLIKTKRSPEEWAKIFERYPTTPDGYVQSFSVEEPEKYLPLLEKYGCVVVRILNEQECKASQVAILEEANQNGSLRKIANIDINDPSTWETCNWPSKSKFLFARIALHDTAFKNRFHPNVHRVFSEILKTKKLWVSIDNWGLMRGTKNLKFTDPETGKVTLRDRDEWRTNLKLHWDLNPWKYLEEIASGHVTQYQGVLALDDCCQDTGSFLTVPCSTRYLEIWCKENRKPHNKTILTRVPDDDEMSKHTQKIPLRAGEMVIWNSGQVHANYPNNNDKMRLIQFIRMLPATQKSQDRDRYAPRRIMKDKRYRHIDLNERGFDEHQQKLLGLKEWD